MTVSDSITNASAFQAEIIIPRHFFATSFDHVLNSIDGILTRSERRLLSLFAFRAYKNGEIYPKQYSIACKLGLSVRQVRRVIASLVKKGFVSVIPSSLLARHCYGKGNRYHLLNHPAYDSMARRSPEMSPEERPATINKSKVIKKNKGVSFDPYAFVERHLLQGKHALSIVEALNGITKRMGSIRNLEGYGNQVVAIQSGNYYARDLEAADEVRKKEPETPNQMEGQGFSLEGCGLMVKRLPTRRIKTQNDLHQEIRAMQGVPDRRCGVSRCLV